MISATLPFVFLACVPDVRKLSTDGNSRRAHTDDEIEYETYADFKLVNKRVQLQ